MSTVLISSLCINGGGLNALHAAHNEIVTGVVNHTQYKAYTVSCNVHVAKPKLKARYISKSKYGTCKGYSTTFTNMRVHGRHSVAMQQCFTACRPQQPCLSMPVYDMFNMSQCVVLCEHHVVVWHVDSPSHEAA
jgi:hypothetical protein